MRETTHYICVTYKITPEDGKFTAYCEELGTASCGNTVDEAAKNIREAIIVHLNTLEHFGERDRYFREHGIRMRSQPTKLSSKPLFPQSGVFVSRQNIPVYA